MRSECPECREPWRAGSKLCRTCGYRDPAAAEQSSPDRWRCADVDRGMRCGKAGTLSPSTNGSGPWYCSEHFPPFRSMGAQARERPYALQRLGEIAARLAPRQPDPEADLEREAIQAEGA